MRLPYTAAAAAAAVAVDESSGRGGKVVDVLVLLEIDSLLGRQMISEVFPDVRITSLVTV